MTLIIAEGEKFDRARKLSLFTAPQPKGSAF